MRITNEAFDRIGKTFGMTLPDWYRGRVLDYPFFHADKALYNDEEVITHANEDAREEGWRGFPWPPEFFIIGDTGDGDSFFIVPRTGDRRIFMTNHEGPDLDFHNLDEMVMALTLEHFVIERQEVMRRSAQMDERSKNKKWWQFWA